MLNKRLLSLLVFISMVSLFVVNADVNSCYIGVRNQNPNSERDMNSIVYYDEVIVKLIN